ncbi:MAG TPA: NAD(P)/FAD-dependent oxidoreductase [Firmicutes bacterium]|nr:NAD(P)/FAD-dependent oxidoreductase [Bacillota bacterium]
MPYHVVIVGGGPAGLLAAIAAAQHGAEVTLLERNNQLGTKLLMSGGGRCNITNAGSIDHLVQSFPSNGRFLYSAFQAFSNRDMLDLLAEEGVLTKEEDRGRIFPVSGDARDVLAALERRAVGLGVRICLNTRVAQIVKKPGLVAPGWQGFSLRTEDGTEYLADRIVLCTGGVTYPSTGSTGDGYAWVKQFGHTMVKPRPAVVALETVEDWPQRVQGVALRGAEVLVYVNNKVVTRYHEDVLFTHFGVSGPAILNVSHHAVQALEQHPGEVELGIRTDSDLRVDDWEARLQMALREHPRQLLKSLVARWWPASLAEALLEVHGIPPEVMANQVTRHHRSRTAELLDEFRLTLKQARPMESAMVTAGGVDVKEIDPRSMRSLKTVGLYIAGELLDVDGVSGGYNLQSAYSTGFVAGKSAATDPAEE